MSPGLDPGRAGLAGSVPGAAQVPVWRRPPSSQDPSRRTRRPRRRCLVVSWPAAAGAWLSA